MACTQESGQRHQHVLRCWSAGRPGRSPTECSNLSNLSEISNLSNLSIKLKMKTIPSNLLWQDWLEGLPIALGWAGSWGAWQVGRFGEGHSQWRWVEVRRAVTAVQVWAKVTVDNEYSVLTFCHCCYQLFLPTVINCLSRLLDVILVYTVLRKYLLSLAGIFCHYMVSTVISWYPMSLADIHCH